MEWAGVVQCTFNYLIYHFTETKANQIGEGVLCVQLLTVKGL